MKWEMYMQSIMRCSFEELEKHIRDNIIDYTDEILAYTGAHENHPVLNRILAKYNWEYNDYILEVERRHIIRRNNMSDTEKLIDDLIDYVEVYDIRDEEIINKIFKRFFIKDDEN